jgi:hypothetical protein
MRRFGDKALGDVWGTPITLAEDSLIFRAVRKVWAFRRRAAPKRKTRFG